jgi:hypothetical protein
MNFEWKEISGETCRTYIFPGGKYDVYNVRRLCVRPSGTHRLETENGHKYIIPTGWIAIEIVAEAWSL